MALGSSQSSGICDLSELPKPELSEERDDVETCCASGRVVSHYCKKGFRNNAGGSKQWHCSSAGEWILDEDNLNCTGQNMIFPYLINIHQNTWILLATEQYNLTLISRFSL